MAMKLHWNLMHPKKNCSGKIFLRNGDSKEFVVVLHALVLVPGRGTPTPKEGIHFEKDDDDDDEEEEEEE